MNTEWPDYSTLRYDRANRTLLIDGTDGLPISVAEYVLPGFAEHLLDVSAALASPPSQPSDAPHQHVGLFRTVTCYAVHAEPPIDLVPSPPPVTEAPASPSGSSEPSTDEAIREALWSLHGHDFIYGDDGEMQCNWSLHMADFKRDPMPKLLEHIAHARLVAASHVAPGLDKWSGAVASRLVALAEHQVKDRHVELCEVCNHYLDEFVRLTHTGP